VLPELVRHASEGASPLKRFLLAVAAVVGSTVASHACDAVSKKVVCTETVLVEVVKCVKVC
jgi:hypothetical protein